MNAFDNAARFETETEIDLEALAKKHLLMHFTPRNQYAEAPLMVIERGEGSWVFDAEGKKYMDALAGLFCVQIGHSHGAEIGAAITRQLEKLPYSTNWSRAHEPSILLAAKVASLAPEGMDRVFFTSGGSDSNESAIKMARQYQQAKGEPTRTKFIARRLSYHGTSYGALSLTGGTFFRKPFEPLMQGARHISNTKQYGRINGRSQEQFTADLLAELESTIKHEGPETVAGLFIEPMQNMGGSIAPPAGYAEGIRAICDKYGVLLICDEVICGFGRLGEWFGSARYGFKPDIITFAKGIGSGYVPLGGVIASNHVADTIIDGPDNMYMHGLTYGGIPSSCAAALANLEIFEREDILGNVRRNEPYLRAGLEALLENPFVGDVRGDGFLFTLELVTDKTACKWDGKTSALDLVNLHIAPALVEEGILCRAGVDSEGAPIIQISPPLILTRDDIDWLVAGIKKVIEDCTAKAN